MVRIWAEHVGNEFHPSPAKLPQEPQTLRTFSAMQCHGSLTSGHEDLQRLTREVASTRDGRNELNLKNRGLAKWSVLGSSPSETSSQNEEEDRSCRQSWSDKRIALFSPARLIYRNIQIGECRLRLHHENNQNLSRFRNRILLP